MKRDPRNLIWLDLEMTGLNPSTDRILEIATVVTDFELNVLAEGPVIVVAQAEAELNKMSDFVRQLHTKTGLLQRLTIAQANEAQAEQQTLDFLQEWVAPEKSPMCGNSICMDRRFLFQWMPKLEKYFHYRSIDVSTIKELANRWRPELTTQFKKENAHQALADVYESIQELQHYRQHFFNFLHPPSK